MKIVRADLLIIGSGIAGLTIAIKTAEASPHKKIVLLCKSEPKEGNTKYAQGGIAVAMKSAQDSPAKHIADTLNAGDGLCNKKVVETVIKEGPDRLQDLIDFGVRFDKTPDGKFDLGMEGGHNSKRIYHRADHTGLEIARKLLAKARKSENIQILDHCQAFELITNEHFQKNKFVKQRACYGSFVLDEKRNQVFALLSPVTVIASGGLGQLFERTTNSETACGEGIALAHRAGAKTKHLAFIQFHPTALKDGTTQRNFLITEALRGFGAILRNINGEAFMKYYDDRKDLATRDIVSRAIANEMKKTNSDSVFLDCRHVDQHLLRKHFPGIVARCMSAGIELSSEMIPVAPAAHYSCGGIVTDLNGRTHVKHLYACGECAETGLHGANRLASNSLLESVVFADRIHKHILKQTERLSPSDKIVTSFEYQDEITSIDKESFRINIRRIMSESLGIVTSTSKIKKGLTEMTALYRRLKLLKNSRIAGRLDTLILMTETSLLVLEDAARKSQNAGVFFNADLDGKPVSGDTVLSGVPDDLYPVCL